MILSKTFHRPLGVAAVALCSLAIVSLATPASARPHHHHRAESSHSHGVMKRHASRRMGKHVSRKHASRWNRSARRAQVREVADANASMGSTSGGYGGSFGSSNVVDEARRYIGGNPTGRGRLWCARFMNMVLQRSGHQGSGSDMARSFASYGQRLSGPQVGAIAVMSRGRRGGHVGIVSGIDSGGNPIVISGNHGRRVAESVYSARRVYAYVMPN